MLDIDLIKDIHLVWSELEETEVDSVGTFLRGSKDIERVCLTMEMLQFFKDDRFDAIRAFGFLQAMNLVAWITSLRKEGVTLKRFLREHKDYIKRYADNEYVKRFIIEKNVDVFYP